jgi:transcriptional regulator with XRE-family HTH domain
MDSCQVAVSLKPQAGPPPQALPTAAGSIPPHTPVAPGEDVSLPPMKSPAQNRHAPCQGNGFGALLRAWREQVGLTQERLAERAGLGVRTIGYLERGQVRPQQQTVRLLAGALGLDEPARTEFAAVAASLFRDDRPPAAAAATAARRSAVAAPAQLPGDVAVFTGRAEQLGQLDVLLAGAADRRGGGGLAHAVVIAAIVGTAGVGKTALAIHWAHRVRERFDGGQLYVDLRGYAQAPPLRPIAALAGFLRALGVAAEQIPADTDQAAALYRSLLWGRRMLVVLDNARDADQVRPLLPGSQECVVLATSRERLAGLVASHDAQRLVLGMLTADEAVSLLRRILGSDRVDAEPAAVRGLAQACGFLPFALRITAAKLAWQPDRSITSYVECMLAGDRLSELAVDGDPHAAVGTAFDCSYAALSRAARRLFRLLGLLPGPEFTAQAAAALAGLPVPEAGRLLERLAAAHLIRPCGQGRFGFHELLRCYARQRAQNCGELRCQ